MAFGLMKKRSEEKERQTCSFCVSSTIASLVSKKTAGGVVHQPVSTKIFNINSKQNRNK